MLCGKTALKSIARFAKKHQEELAQCLPLPRGKVPSYSTFQRLSQHLPIESLCKNFNCWMAQHIKTEDIAIDGKSIRSTITNATNSEQSFTSLVSFFGQKSQLIRQVGVLENNKRSEIHLVQELIQKLQINQAVFTLDALHCQKKTVSKITSSNNGYIIAVKQNQPRLHQSIVNQCKTIPSDAWSWKQTGHGHDTKCRLKVWLADDNMKKEWSSLQAYASVRRQGMRDGKFFDTTTYYITSEPMSAWCLAQRIRAHRKIENTLHWTKDVVLNEDECGLTDSQSAANMAIIRNISFNLLVMAGYQSISQGISAMGEKIKTLWKTIVGDERKFMFDK